MPIEPQITLHFGGGSLYLKCHKCKQEIAAAEVDFPGTPEQQKEPRAYLAKKEMEHLHKCFEMKHGDGRNSVSK